MHFKCIFCSYLKQSTFRLHYIADLWKMINFFPITLHSPPAKKNSLCNYFGPRSILRSIESYENPWSGPVPRTLWTTFYPRFRENAESENTKRKPSPDLMYCSRIAENSSWPAVSRISNLATFPSMTHCFSWSLQQSAMVVQALLVPK